MIKKHNYDTEFGMVSMTTGSDIEKRGHIIGFKEEISKSAQLSDDAFFTWFNESKDKDTSFVRGYWDFVFHILSPSWKYISTPESKIALEIGYGGGRLLSAASRFFSSVIGVDIHDNSELVSKELFERGINNFKLLTSDGASIQLGDDKIDFVYSFIVLQHVERYEILVSYMRDVHRILKSGGVAVLYFGRKTYFPNNQNSSFFVFLDKFCESIFISRGYREIPARVNETNLVVTLVHIKNVAKQLGFDVVADMVSRKKVPDGIRTFGGQHGLVLIKR